MSCNLGSSRFNVGSTFCSTFFIICWLACSQKCLIFTKDSHYSSCCVCFWCLGRQLSEERPIPTTCNSSALCPWWPCAHKTARINIPIPLLDKHHHHISSMHLLQWCQLLRPLAGKCPFSVSIVRHVTYLNISFAGHPSLLDLRLLSQLFM